MRQALVRKPLALASGGISLAVCKPSERLAIDQPIPDERFAGGRRSQVHGQQETKGVGRKPGIFAVLQGNRGHLPAKQRPGLFRAVPQEMNKNLLYTDAVLVEGPQPHLGTGAHQTTAFF